jgi:hypothetical protein
MAPARGQHENSEPCHTSAFSADGHRQGPERQQQATPPALAGTEPGPDHDVLESASPAPAATRRPAAPQTCWTPATPDPAGAHLRLGARLRLGRLAWMGPAGGCYGVAVGHEGGDRLGGGGEVFDLAVRQLGEPAFREVDLDAGEVKCRWKRVWRSSRICTSTLLWWRSGRRSRSMSCGCNPGVICEAQQHPWAWLFRNAPFAVSACCQIPENCC